MDLLLEVKNQMGVLVQFILDNLNDPVTRGVQIEFNLRYESYREALVKVRERDGITEDDAIDMGTLSPVQVPDHLVDQFESWLDERLDVMLTTGGSKKTLN